MDACKEELLRLSSEKDKEVETYLEEFTEEKVAATMQIKQKYSKMLTLLKVSAAKPGNQAAAAEKIAALEEKKRGEESEILAELAQKRAENLQEIKNKYNQLAADVKLDFNGLKEALKRIKAETEGEKDIDNIDISVSTQLASQQEYGLDGGRGVMGDRKR